MEMKINNTMMGKLEEVVNSKTAVTINSGFWGYEWASDFAGVGKVLDERGREEG